MKNYSSMEVTPAPHPIAAIEQRFVFNQPITLLLDEKRSFSGDDFSIKDSNGVSYFKCKGKTFSFRDKKIIYDLYDKPIFNIQENAFIGHGQKIYAGKSTDKIIGSVSRKSMLKKNKYELSYTNIATGQSEILDLKCDFMGCSCGIFCGKEKDGAPMICSISKTKKLLSFVSDRDHYAIRIAPGVDAALMVALTIIFDELKNEDEE
ncbi:hypothetical protein PIROE2DRAFT_44444 [Piromyces sp. E2]|nr:hypothetical protein PIROE2DRAFT_44444 [Piromyces sp. E2]|eukprot:OUM62297.1 hypothetical protein PIROE2DRAFT_44444 [Piromyces sp. E2]